MLIAVYSFVGAHRKGVFWVATNAGGVATNLGNN